MNESKVNFQTIANEIMSGKLILNTGIEKEIVSKFIQLQNFITENLKQQQKLKAELDTLTARFLDLRGKQTAYLEMFINIRKDVSKEGEQNDSKEGKQGRGSPEITGEPEELETLSSPSGR